MTAAAWLELIKGVLKFPQDVLALVRVFQKTPVQKQDDLRAQMQKSLQSFQDTGRPQWD